MPTHDQPDLTRWQDVTRPVLSALSDGNTWETIDLRSAVLAAQEISGDAAVVDPSDSRYGEIVRRAIRRLASAGAVTKLSPSRTVITDRGQKLLEENPVGITLDTLNKIPAYREAARQRNSPSNTEPGEMPSYWFVGAYYYGEEVEDLTDTFVEEGTWQNGYADKYLDDVRSIQAGERIAIKAAYTRLYDVPFETNGHRVSVLAIKATGTVTRNHGDGRTLDVDWDPREPIREWYFYTNQRTVWRVRPGDWRTDALIDFTFDGGDQHVDRFRNSPFWAARFGDDAGLAEETEIAVEVDAEEAEEEELQGSHLGYTLADVIVDGCFVPKSDLTSYLSTLRTKKNLILQGPPGTGKTWLAKRLGYALIGAKDRALLRAIQFHPTLAYEDFVRGWRPSGDGKLSLEDGIFLDIVNAAQADPGHDHVVVIEEINRGNLAQIFGELLTLLESDKRSPEEALELSYRRKGEPPVYLPENLYIIGTMNLADRSLAIVDFALRRRFGFANLEPTLNKQWRNWVSDRNGVNDGFLAALAGRVDALNTIIAADRSLGEQYRIGHSFFTPHVKARIEDPASWLRQIVESEIQPLLGEYWFDEPERARKEAEALLGYPL